MANEYGFRPKTIADLNGQPKIQKMLKVYIKAAEIKGESFPHTIVTGPSGCGKSTTAMVIANELGRPYKAFAAPAINDVKTIQQILIDIKENDVIYLDEIHRLNKKLQEMLYFAMEQFQADVEMDGKAVRIGIPHFTLIASTNLYGGLNDALLNRFPIQLKLAAYNDDSMTTIVKTICKSKGIKIDNESASMIAATTRGVPRNANSYVARIYDFALVMNNGIITPDIVVDGFDIMGINKYGLNQDDMDYLRFLASNTKAVGIDTCALTLGMDKDTIITKIQPYLLKKKYIQKQPRGRVATGLGRKICEETN